MEERMEAALRGCVERYEEAVDSMTSRLRPGDGVLGMGRDPRRDPCHMAFYEEVGETVARFQATEPEAGEVVQAVRFLLTLGQGDRRPLVRPMLEAAQGHALPLIPLLEPGQALSTSVGTVVGSGPGRGAALLVGIMGLGMVLVALGVHTRRRQLA